MTPIRLLPFTLSQMNAQLSSLKCLPLLGALSLSTPSCDSSDSAASTEAKEKPNAKHHSTATLQIHQTPFYEAQPDQEPSENFLSNQIAIISANSVIEEAAAHSQIDARIIQEALWIKPLIGTDLISLSAYHDNPATAKHIAEAVIESYISHRNTLELARANAALETLDTELLKQSDLVQDLRKELTILIQQYGIPYFDGQSANPTGTTEEERYRLAQKKLDDYETQHDQLTIQIQRIKTAAKEDIVPSAAGLDLPENQVTEYYRSYRQLENEIYDKMHSGLGKDHPSIVQLQQQADQKLAHARAEVVTLQQVLETKLLMLNRQIEKMREIINDKQNTTVELSLKQHNYTQAKEDYEQSRDMYREMKIKQQESRVLLKMPRTPVTIHGWEHN